MEKEKKIGSTPKENTKPKQLYFMFRKQDRGQEPAQRRFYFENNLRKQQAHEAQTQ